MSDLTPIPAPLLQPITDTPARQEFSLWRDAPGWRNLVLSAIGVSCALLALPLITTTSADGPNQEVASCQGNAAAFAGPSGRGRVVGFLSSDQALKLLQNTQFSSRLAINPDYLANVRSLVHLDGSLEGSRMVYLVPQEVSVKIGDQVDVAGGHVDPHLPCHYIPNRIVQLSQP